ncbi:hypothetical protein CLU85_2511 [Acidovorax sp. 69]|uniref:hypothetical protein n=1 Tax=Acidovorax sp. 69 TaxID=2035202 RepID=UPI000C24CC07|nr:hypothetical protein [Acidovorax sp. 69]PJI97715.1 hypothetical protein CLU85_2511 [Acidovorax sp. 69]
MASASPDITATIAAAQAFIQRWQHNTASELATAQSFVMDLCELLGVTKPHPTPDQDYMFERPITFAHGDGTGSAKKQCTCGPSNCRRPNVMPAGAPPTPQGRYRRYQSIGHPGKRATGPRPSRMLVLQP